MAVLGCVVVAAAGFPLTAEVLGAKKGDKLITVKYKRRKGYHKKQGHRQRYLRVKITGINVFTTHHDISTVTGEEVILFTLATSPAFRDPKKK